MINKTLYAIRMVDVISAAKETGIKYSPKDIDFIQDKIGDYIGSQWYDAIEYALNELQEKQKRG